MDSISINTESSKTPDPYKLLFNLSDKTNIKKSNKYVALSNLSIYYKWKNIKKSYKENKCKISAPFWNKNLNNQIDHTVHQIFMMISSIS